MNSSNTSNVLSVLLNQGGWDGRDM
jgi:hypothetical protein